jgi:hypothetical protein
MDKYLDSSDVLLGTPSPEGRGLFDVNKITTMRNKCVNASIRY